MAEPYKPGLEKPSEEWKSYLETLEDRFPHIEWMSPVLMTNIQTGSHGLGCRICISWFGIVGNGIKDLPINLEEHHKHLKEYHGLE